MNRLSTILKSIINVIGNVTMGTSATTLTGAIAEHETQLTELQTSPSIKWYYFSTGTQTWASGLSTYTVTIPTALSGYYRWVVGDRSTNRNVSYIWAFGGNGTTLTLYVYNSSSSSASGVIGGMIIFVNNDLNITP